MRGRNDSGANGESGQNDSGANGKVGETTRGRNDSRRKGKWAKRLRGERESGRKDRIPFLKVRVVSRRKLRKLFKVTASKPLL